MRILCCPTKCSGGDSTRQHPLSDGQLAKLSANARVKIESARGAMRCSYCGCVHVDHDGKRLSLGSLDGGLTCAGWVSTKYP